MIVPIQLVYDVPDGSNCIPTRRACNLYCIATRDHTCTDNTISMSFACCHKHISTDMHTHYIIVSWCAYCLHWHRQAFGYIPTIHYVFKVQWIHGIVQFTMCITSRCILHRAPNQHINRNIRCNVHFVIVRDTHVKHVFEFYIHYNLNGSPYRSPAAKCRLLMMLPARVIRRAGRRMEATWT